MTDDGNAESRPRLASVDWWFRDRDTGEIVVAQFPNAPLWIFLACVGSGAFFPDDAGIGTSIRWVGTGAIAWWALDELVRGVNPWRRLLGACGCGFAVARVVSLLT